MEVFSKIILFIVITLVSVVGGYFINRILKRFPSQLHIHLEESEKHDHQVYQDVIKEDYSLSFVGKYTLHFIFIILLTSVIETLIFYFSKSRLDYLFYYVTLCLTFLMVIRLPLIIEFFIRSNRREKSTLVKRMTEPGCMFYRTYICRIRPVLYGVSIIPLIIGCIFYNI